MIIGFVDEIQEQVTSYFNNFEIYSTTENEYYGSTRIGIKKGQVVNFLGVKYSFWGCISSFLSYELCRLGCNQIIYVGKLGSLRSYTDIYHSLFSPRMYLYMQHTEIIAEQKHVYNPIAEMFPELDSGTHVSVSTVVEEDFLQRAKITKIGASSIDNEVSQMQYMNSTLKITVL